MFAPLDTQCSRAGFDCARNVAQSGYPKSWHNFNKKMWEFGAAKDWGLTLFCTGKVCWARSAGASRLTSVARFYVEALDVA